MKKIKFPLTILAAIVGIVSLTSMALVSPMGETAMLAKEFNLSSFGIPVTVSAPDGAEVKKGLMGGEVDGVQLINVDIKKDNFVLSVMMWDQEPEGDLESAVEDARGVTEETDGFKGYILEEENGYIAKIVEDGETDYDFTYVLEKDDRHIEFMTGLSMKNFTEAEVRAMYAAAKAAH
jgi:hypothetical protein